MEFGVHGAEHETHPAAAQSGEDLVSADFGTWLQFKRQCGSPILARILRRQNTEMCTDTLARFPAELRLPKLYRLVGYDRGHLRP